jgi:hypothetical protein
MGANTDTSRLISYLDSDTLVRGQEIGLDIESFLAHFCEAREQDDFKTSLEHAIRQSGSIARRNHMFCESIAREIDLRS